MYCTEMTCNITELLVINNAHHFDSKSTLGCLGGCDFSSVLTSGKKDMELLQFSIVEKRANGSRSARLYKFKDSNGN